MERSTRNESLESSTWRRDREPSTWRSRELESRGKSSFASSRFFSVVGEPVADSQPEVVDALLDAGQVGARRRFLFPASQPSQPPTTRCSCRLLDDKEDIRRFVGLESAKPWKFIPQDSEMTERRLERHESVPLGAEFLEST